MAKFYRASITFDIYPSDNGLLEWQDEEDDKPLTEEELSNYARSELLEALYNGLKYNEIEDMIEVEAIEEEA
jgi:hypothetical protein